jgi:hypothetical protein
VKCVARLVPPPVPEGMEVVSSRVYLVTGRTAETLIDPDSGDVFVYEMDDQPDE